MTGRTVERDRIELPGPPCRAVIRYWHHRFDGGRRDYTEFTAEPAGNTGALRVSTSEWSGALNPFYGGRDIDIGDVEFDRHFVIQSNPPDLAPRFLDPPTREMIRSFVRYGDGTFLLQFRPGQLLVRVSMRIQQGPMLERFIDQCYGLVARLPAVSEGGIELGMVVSGAGTCPVCGTKTEPASRVQCRSCATPHHAECWTYNDGCSTFACGERRSRRA